MASNSELAQRYFDEVFVDRDFQVLDDLCAPDCLFHDPVHGPLDVREMKGVLADMDQLVTVIDARLEDLVDAGDTQVLRYTMKASMNGPFAGFEATGRAGDASGIAICRFDGGKLSEQWAIWNMLEFLQHAGAFERRSEAPPLELYSDATAP